MGLLHFDNFDTDTLGSLPSGWTNGAGSLVVGTIHPVSGSHALGESSPSDGDFAYYIGSGKLTACSISYSGLVQMTGSIGSPTALCVPQADLYDPTTGDRYILYYDLQAGGGRPHGGLAVYRLSASAGNGAVGSIAFPSSYFAGGTRDLQNGDILHGRVSWNAGTFSARAWVNSDPEPTTYIGTTLTDTNITSCYPGAGISIGGSGAATGSVDDFQLTDLTPAISPTTPSITSSGTQQFIAYDFTGTIAWSSGTTGVATIDSSTGLVTAVSAGTTLVTASDGAHSANTTLTVTASSTVTSVTVSPPTPTVAGSGTQAFTAVVNGTGSPSQSVTWGALHGSFSGATYTAPAATGSIQTDTVTATSVQDGSKSGTATVTIPANTTPALSPTSATLSRGATQQLTASNFAGGSVTWASSNTAVATVSNSGLVTAVGPGSATITATGVSNAGQSATCTITGSAVTLTVNPTSGTIQPAATLQLTPTVGGAVNTAVAYASSNTAVATVNSSGLVTAAAIGSATITITSAADNSITTTCTITVTSTVTIYDVTILGGGYTGLVGTIGQKWEDASGTVVQARTTAGIVEIAPGAYKGGYTGASPGSAYFSIWDTGGGSPIYDVSLPIYAPGAPVPIAAGGIDAAQLTAAAVQKMQVGLVLNATISTVVTSRSFTLAFPATAPAALGIVGQLVTFSSGSCLLQSQAIATAIPVDSTHVAVTFGTAFTTAPAPNDQAQVGG